MEELHLDNVRDSLRRIEVAAKPTIPRPCTGKRPYRSWSNAEISIALGRYAGTDNPALMDLIEEAGCRSP